MDNTFLAMEPGQHLSEMVGKVLILHYKKGCQMSTVTEMKKTENYNTPFKLFLKETSSTSTAEILNRLLVSHLERILHIIDELGFHFGKRTIFFYTCLHFCFNVFYRTRFFWCFRSSFLFFLRILDLWSRCRRFQVFSILVWFLCIFGWSILYRFLYWSFFL